MKNLFKQMLFPAGKSFVSILNPRYSLPILLATLITQHPTLINAQVAIGDSLKSVDGSAVLELFSQTKGFLPPRMTTAQRDSITNPAEGLVVFDTDLNKLLYYHNGWNDFGLWTLRDSASTGIYYTGKVTIGPSSGTDTIPASLNISGTAGIYASVYTDTSVPAYYFIDTIDNGLDFNIGTFINTFKTGTPSEAAIGSYSYLESGDINNIGLGGEAFYTGSGGDLNDFEAIPRLAGVIGNNYVADTGAVALAAGAVGVAESDHRGANAGVIGTAASATAFANVGGAFTANDAGNADFMEIVHDSFPGRFTAAALLYNFNSGSRDFNLFALGDAPSHFEGQVTVGYGSYAIASQHPLTAGGSRGIRSELEAGAFSGPAPHYFNAALTHPSGSNAHFVVNTERTGTAGQRTTAMSSFLEGADTVLVAFMGQGFYSGSGGDLNNPQYLPQTGGVVGDAYISDTLAEVFAAGTAGLASSAQAGINIGTFSLATQADYSNIASYAVANREADSYKYLIDTLRSLFPVGFTAGLFVNNGDSTPDDFNIYAYGDAKSYFGGKVGIGTSFPSSKLDVAGAVNADAYLVNGDTLNIDGAWSKSGNDIYYDAGNVNIGGLITADLSGNFNAVGQVTMINDTLLDDYPKMGFLMRTDTLQAINGWVDIAHPVVGMGIVDTTSLYGAPDTVGVHFSVERTAGLGVIGTWVCKVNDEEISYMILNPKGIGINTGSPDTELHVNGNTKQKIHTSNVSNPPTDAQLDGLFTGPSSKGDGWTAYVKDSDTDNLYQIMVVGSNWYILTTAKAQ